MYVIYHKQMLRPDPFLQKIEYIYDMIHVKHVINFFGPFLNISLPVFYLIKYSTSRKNKWWLRGPIKRIWTDHKYDLKTPQFYYFKIVFIFIAKQGRVTHPSPSLRQFPLRITIIYYSKQKSAKLSLHLSYSYFYEV